MKALIEAEVELWDIAVFAELALWEPRPELEALCIRARERGKLDAETVGAVLPGLSPRACKNLLRSLGHLRLVDPTGSLTALGQRCAATGSAPAWELGVYHLLVARHPLFGSHFLDFMRTSGDSHDREFDNSEPIPAWIVPPRERVFQSVFDRSKRFGIVEFPAVQGQNAHCRLTRLAPARLVWHIDLATGDNSWTLQGHIADGAARRTFESSPDHVAPDELDGLFAHWEPRWNEREGRVAMAYDCQADETGQDSFLRSWRYPQVQVGRRGTYSQVQVRDVPVGPATDPDARAWAMAILLARLEAADAYLVSEQLSTRWQDALEGTPLAGRAGSAPAARLLAGEKLNGRPLSARTSWLISAGADLGRTA